MKHLCKVISLLAMMNLLIASPLFSQELNWGPLMKSSSKNVFPRMLGGDEDNFYILMEQGNKQFLEAYTQKEQKRLYSRELELDPVNGNDVSLEGITYLDGHFLVFYSYFNSKTRDAIIAAKLADGKDGRLNEKPMPIMEVPVEKKRRDGEFYLFLSMDKSKILVNHFVYSKKQKQYKDVYKLYDAKLNLITEREDIVNSKERNFRTGNFIIDNEGSVYFTKTMNSGKTYLVTYDANKEYEKWEEEIDLTLLGLDLKSTIKEVSFVINNDNDLLVTGYYAKADNTLEGCFFMKVDGLTKEIQLKKVNEFTKDFKAEFRTEKQKRKDKDGKIAANFVSRAAQIKPDGSVVQIGEFYYHNYVYNAQGGTSGEVIFYGDLMVANYNPEGDLLWIKRIPKSQLFHYSISYGCIIGSYGLSIFTIPWDIPRAFSFTSALSDNKLHILFNDNPKNNIGPKQNSKTYPLKNLSNLAVVLYTFDMETGEAVTTQIRDAVDKDIAFKPSQSFPQEKSGHIILFGSKKKKYTFGEYKLE